MRIAAEWGLWVMERVAHTSQHQACMGHPEDLLNIASTSGQSFLYEGHQVIADVIGRRDQEPGLACEQS